jgi:membrane-associated phospholipid phosphatase
MDTAVGNFFFALRTPARTAFFTIITDLGNAQTIGVLFAIVTAVPLYKRNYRQLFALVAATGIAEAVTYVLKIIVHRARPMNALMAETDYSFPSGHATIAVAFYGFMALLLIKKSISKNVKVAIAVVAGLLILLIGISRLYLGVHYFTDVVAGYIVGSMGILIGLALL